MVVLSNTENVISVIWFEQGYTDHVYRQRRKMIGDIAFRYRQWVPVFCLNVTQTFMKKKKRKRKSIIITDYFWCVYFSVVGSQFPEWNTRRRRLAHGKICKRSVVNMWQSSRPSINITMNSNCFWTREFDLPAVWISEHCCVHLPPAESIYSPFSDS